MNQKLDEYRAFAERYHQLQRIARRLHRYYEIACIMSLTPRQTKTVERLEREAQDIAHSLGFQAYFQSDPRGLPVYLIPQDWDWDKARSQYSQGIPVYL